MVVKQCFAFLTGVITLGVATMSNAQQSEIQNTNLKASGSQQSVRNNPWHQNAGSFVLTTAPNFASAFSPTLLTPSQIFNTPVAVPMKSVTHLNSTGDESNDGAHSRVASYPLYSFGPTAFDGIAADYFRNTYTITATGATVQSYWIYQEFDLPGGTVGTTGASMTSIITTLRNIAAVSTAHVQDVYGTITIYDTWNINVANNSIAESFPEAAGPVLGAFDFHVMNLPVRSSLGDFFEFTLPTPITLHHDANTPGELPYAYGMQFWDDAAHTIPCTSITSMHADNTATQTVQVDVGLGYNRDWINLEDNPPPYNDGFSDGTAASPLEFLTMIKGTAPNPLTYSVSGTVIFPTLQSTTGSPYTFYQGITLTLHSHAGGADTVVTGEVGLSDNIDPVSGASNGQTGGFGLGWVPAGTYDLTLTGYGFTPVTIPNIVVTNKNVYGLSATIDTPTKTFENVTGTFELEGVSDFSTANDGSLLGTQGGNNYFEDLYDISFRLPGTTTAVFDVVGVVDATTSGPTFTYSGYVPDGTYDVLAIGTINLGVLQKSVKISSTSTTVPDFGALPAGDSNGDNVVDTYDFNRLTGAFGNSYDPNDPTDQMSGYDPFVDFDFSGTIDTGDFNLLVGEYGNSGAI